MACRIALKKISETVNLEPQHGMDNIKFRKKWLKTFYLFQLISVNRSEKGFVKILTFVIPMLFKLNVLLGHFSDVFTVFIFCKIPLWHHLFLLLYQNEFKSNDGLIILKYGCNLFQHFQNDWQIIGWIVTLQACLFTFIFYFLLYLNGRVSLQSHTNKLNF